MDDIINKRAIELFKKSYLNNDHMNMNMRVEILQKLESYQHLHAMNMQNAMINNRVAFDGSHTGTGKTYTTIAVCSQLNLTPLIICPKSVINKWMDVCISFGVTALGIANYEMIRSGKYYEGLNLEQNECPFLKYENNKYIWNFSQLKKKESNVVLIFDEAHKCKNTKSLNGKLLISAKGTKLMLLSATICDKPEDFGIFGMVLGFYKSPSCGRKWIGSLVRSDRNKFSFNKKNILHEYLYPEKGSMMSIENLGKDFPMNQICIECIPLEEKDMKKIKKKQNDRIDNNKLAEINDLRQKIENAKVKIMIEMFDKYYEGNKSIIFFVNYHSTFRMIIERLENRKIDFSKIIGEQKLEERNKEINRFQKNIVRCIVCMIQVGGTAIDLEDTSGCHPRVSIISPSYSSIELIQALGRAHRSSSKSPCIQIILFCAGTYEENVANILKKKRDFILNITDDDLKF
jgi:SNF2 family DNA or RNA helicase